MMHVREAVVFEWEAVVFEGVAVVFEWVAVRLQALLQSGSADQREGHVEERLRHNPVMCGRQKRVCKGVCEREGECVFLSLP